MPLTVSVDGNGDGAVLRGVRRAKNMRGSHTADIVLGRLTAKENHQSGERAAGVHRYDGTRH